LFFLWIRQGRHNDGPEFAVHLDPLHLLHECLLCKDKCRGLGTAVPNGRSPAFAIRR
jgi:hypothetical protein